MLGAAHIGCNAGSFGEVIYLEEIAKLISLTSLSYTVSLHGSPLVGLNKDQRSTISSF